MCMHERWNCPCSSNGNHMSYGCACAPFSSSYMYVNGASISDWRKTSAHARIKNLPIVSHTQVEQRSITYAHARQMKLPMFEKWGAYVVWLCARDFFIVIYIYIYIRERCLHFRLKKTICSCTKDETARVGVSMIAVELRDCIWWGVYGACSTTHGLHAVLLRLGISYIFAFN